MHSLNRVVGLSHVTQQTPCPHCGKTDWCYQIGELTACKRNALPANGWIATSKCDKEATPYYAPADRTEREKRPKQETHFDYPDRSGHPLVRVIRVDDGEGHRKFFQQRWSGKTWRKGLKGVSRASIPIYRYKEVRSAIKRGEPIFVVEGEGVADLLWEKGIPATTNIGGSKKWKDSDSADLKGAEIVICPDRDQPGVEHANRIAQDFPSAKWLYAFPQSPFWEQLPQSNGLDLKDWIVDYGLTKERIFGAIEPTRRQLGESPEKESKAVRPSDPASQMGADEVLLPLRQWADEGLSGSALRSQLNGLAGSSGWHVIELEKLYKDLQDELEAENDREDLRQQIDGLLAAKTTAIQLEEVLPESIAKPLNRMAQWQNLRPECYLISLLSAVSALHKNGTELIIHRAMDFSVTPNLFGAIVAESSQKKSPIVKTIISKPFSTLNKQAKEEYKAQMEDWREECKGLDKDDPKPPEPQRKIYSFNQTTGEAILRQASRHPKQGLLWLTDELPALFKGANQYRGGKGSDLEDMLTYYDGSGGLVLRADGVRDDVDSLNLGIFGGIQPGVLQKFLGECQDDNGNWARFFFIQQPTAPSAMPDDSGSIGLNDLLVGLYEKVDGLTTRVYRLSTEAFQYFRNVYNRLEIRRCNEPKQALRAVWGKTAGRIGKLALNLHVIKALASRQTPSEEIGLDTVKAATKLANLAVRQIEALYSELGEDSGLAPQLLKVLELSQRATEMGGWLKAKTVQLAFTRSKRPKPETVRGWFSELAEMGLGKLRGSGRYKEFSALVDKSRQKVDEVSTFCLLLRICLPRCRL